MTLPGLAHPFFISTTVPTDNMNCPWQFMLSVGTVVEMKNGWANPGDVI
jgi:hypothetical protein